MRIVLKKKLFILFVPPNNLSGGFRCIPCSKVAKTLFVISGWDTDTRRLSDVEPRILEGIHMKKIFLTIWFFYIWETTYHILKYKPQKYFLLLPHNITEKNSKTNKQFSLYFGIHFGWKCIKFRSLQQTNLKASASPRVCDFFTSNKIFTSTNKCTNKLDSTWCFSPDVYFH